MNVGSRGAVAGSSLLENVGGFFAIGFAFATPFMSRRRRRWGATDDEVEGVHPGDELVPQAQWTATHAVSIAASPQEVWPWIAQVGQGRGGFYSYQRLENLAGCEIENTQRILEEHQDVRVGDKIRLHVDIPPMTAAIVDKPTTLVVSGDPSADAGAVEISSSWAFLLVEQPDGTTRLLSRTRYHHGGGLRAKLMGGPYLVEPISFVMERKMLKVIKGLAEGRGTD